MRDAFLELLHSNVKRDFFYANVVDNFFIKNILYSAVFPEKFRNSLDFFYIFDTIRV
jgi:hypothetical protein